MHIRHIHPLFSPLIFLSSPQGTLFWAVRYLANYLQVRLHSKAPQQGSIVRLHGSYPSSPHVMPPPAPLCSSRLAPVCRFFLVHHLLFSSFSLSLSSFLSHMQLKRSMMIEHVKRMQVWSLLYIFPF